jgi:hypothetical protein
VGPAGPLSVGVGEVVDLIVVPALGVAYDQARDVRIRLDGASERLFASAPTGRVGAIDRASTLDGDVAPDRLVSGPSLPLSLSFGGYLDPTQ